MSRYLVLMLLSVGVVACSSNKNTATDAQSSGASSTNGGQDGNGSTGGEQAAQGLKWPTCAIDGSMAQATSATTAVCSTGGNVQVNVVVDASKGPNAFIAPKQITNKLYSMGIDDHTRSDYLPTLSPVFVSYLKALHPGMLRFPAGYNGQHMTWGTSSTDLKIMSPALIDAFMALCRAVGADPFLAVNIETGPQPLADAVTFVTYTNKTKNYGVKWWQIGNEPNLVEAYPEQSPTKYAATYLQFRSAMLKVDNSLKFVGIESYTGEDLNYNQNEPNWLKPFLAAIGPGEVDAFAYHYYPLTSATSYTYPNSSIVPSITHLLQENATDWPPSALNYPDKIMPYMRQQIAAKVPDAEVWVDEFAEDSGVVLNGVGYSDVMLGALWAADSMGRHAGQGTDAIFHFIFKAVDAKTEFGYTMLDANDKPRPEYYTLWLMANHFGDHMVSATSDNRQQVAVHAAILASDCSLRVMLINKGTTAQSVRLTLKGYTPTSASQYNFVGAGGYQTKDVSLNGATLNDANINNGAGAIPAIAADACTDNVLNVPAYSVNMLIFKKT